MARVDRIDLDRAFEQVRTAAFKLGRPSLDFWSLREPDGASGTRQPWAIHNGVGRRLVVLGYTRREALRSLNAQADLLNLLTL